MLKLLFKSRLSAFFLNASHLQYKIDKHSINLDMRQRLVELELSEEDFFTECLLNALSINMPKSFLENFKNIIHLVNNELPHKPQKIVTSSGLYLCDLSTFWIAIHKMNGVDIHFLQHGGGYNTFDSLLFKLFELQPCTTFFSWGWKLSKNISLSIKVIPFYITKLSGGNVRKSKSNILFVSTCLPKRSFIISSNSYFNLQDYFNIQFELIKRLIPLFNQSLLLRLYPLDYGWKIEAYYKQNYPNLRLDFPSNISLHKSIARSKLVIVDHCMTTMLETFPANIPTVLFWSKTVHATILEDSKPFFDELKNAKILFHDINELIIALNHINKDVDA